MDEEIDEVWEVDLFGSYSYWIPEEEYKRIKELMLDETFDKVNSSIVFNSLDGQEIVILATNICNLCHSTREQRIASRESNKKYKAEWEEKKKEPWEE